MRKIVQIFVAFSEKLNCTKTNVVIFKTGGKCVRIRVKLIGDALENGPKPVQGKYKRLRSPFNDKAIYQHLTNGPWEGSKFGIWWDKPKTIFQDKENSKGGDRSHWKIGIFGYSEDPMFQFGWSGGYLDTYKSPRQSGLAYSKRNKWSYYVKELCHSVTARPICITGHWEDSEQASREISVKCVRRG